MPATALALAISALLVAIVALFLVCLQADELKRRVRDLEETDRSICRELEDTNEALDVAVKRVETLERLLPTDPTGSE